MTIQFHCPKCNALIAFDSKYAGKRARCTTCGQIFIIPFEDHKKAEKIKPKIQRPEPLPGFYRAVFIDSWKLFFRGENITTLIFVVAVICFKFFLAGSCCLGHIAHFVIWGWLLGFYLNIIYQTAFDIDTLPEIYLGEKVAFLWLIIKPFLLFFCTMTVVLLPFIITLMLLKDKGITSENIWQGQTSLHLLLQALFIFGLFLFPIAILTTVVGADITLFRPDYLLAPILKVFIPYLVVITLLTAAAILETQTTQYTAADLPTTASDLSLNLAVQILAIIAMRSIGLFYRHYSCHFKW